MKVSPDLKPALPKAWPGPRIPVPGAFHSVTP